MLKKKILIICPHPINSSPGQRLKYEQYFDNWKSNNYQITISSFMSNDFWKIVYLKGNLFRKLYWTVYGYLKRYSILFHIRKYDLVYVFLWGTPFGFPLYERFLRHFAKNLIYDIDDLVFLGQSSSANSFLKNIKGSSKMHYLMKNADYVITCTPTLDEYVRKFNPNTTDISSTVNTDTRYLFDETRYSKNDSLVIGWSGSHSTSKYLYLLKNVLKRLASEFKFQLVVMGDKTFHIDGVNSKALDWNKEYEMEVLNQFDIGLYPIPDEPWVYGKSGLKAIQYQALGIPVVASKIGANNRVIIDNETGFLVQWDSEEEWYDKIKELILSPDLRRKMGTEGRKHIVKNYSVSSTKQVYLDIFEKVISS